MTLKEFKDRVFEEFGHNLEKATPANVREFIDTIYMELLGGKYKGATIILDERMPTYEAIIKDFFVKTFDFSVEEGFILLWLMAFELSFSAVEYQYAERLASLFKDLE